jgi:hypothetical protein
MIDAVMFGALGFLIASLFALMLAPPLWHRAVRLTTRKLEATMPMSVADIQADKDQLRAEFAIELRRVEVALAKAKDKAARELAQANKRRVEIAVLNTELATVKAQLQENDNENRVLEQTIRRRLPDLDSRLKAAKDVIAALESVNTELRSTVGSQSEALKVARSTVNSQRSDIDQLRGALEGEAAPLRRSTKSDARLGKENQRVTAELSKLKEELERSKVSAEENELLRQELGKLASRILAAAQAQGEGSPERVAVQFTETFADISEALALGEPEPAWHGGNGAGKDSETVGITEAAVETEEQQTPAAGEPDVTEDATEPQGPLAKRLAARRAKRRARKGHGQSLSERLKSVPAEAPET